MKKLIFATNNSKHLVLNNKNIRIGRFVDGEISLSLKANIKGANVFIIGSTNPPSDNLVELLLLIDTVVSKGAKKITVIIPYFGYARSDRNENKNEIACGHAIVKILENTGNKKLKIATFNMHSQILKHFFTIPIQDINTIPLLAKKFVSFKKLSVVAPDRGASKNAKLFAKEIGITNIITLSKKRLTDSKVKITSISKKVSGDAVIVDDMVSTGNTIIETAKILRSNGVQNIYVAITHMVYTAGGWIKLSKSPLIKRVFLTNTINPIINLPKKFKVININQMINNLINKV